ncbi:ABC transporter substrate-binding protein [Paenibacillus sp. Soil724D2]|uniref:ABC transporter substrate-binding protein n=1 Tax=Paenibacillus sp. (strain Soil724D2) TaxID=1736392 RepID=UPI000715D4C0|nr:extracellular solute-binding protein [Paenibacillus sp. Soil724D2]KRE48421.1 binding protein msmE [Paenibacillus sp. Soil724D2]
MKKILSLSSVLILCATLAITGCSSKPNSANDSKSNSPTASDKPVKLTMYTTSGDKPLQAVFQRILNDYTKQHPNVTIELQNPSDYESLMKMKMASNDLPDLFDTHGWAQIRYGKFLADLSKEPWAANIEDSMKPIVTDKVGKVYVLPLNAAKDGITYNKDILDKYNIAVPKTMDELIAAGEKIKSESKGQVTPFFLSAADAGTMAQYLDEFATSQLISPKNNEAESLLNGTFDWTKWTPLAKNLKELFDKKLMPEDVMSLKETERISLFAQGKFAFNVGGPGFVPDALKINPNVHYGIMPVPSIVPGDEPTFSGGERFTLGAWKDGKNVEISKDVIREFAKPANLKEIAEVSGTPAGMKDINPDLGIFTEYYNKYKDIRVFPYFDRVYLPSGTWDVLQTLSAQLISGKITPEQYSEKMKTEVARLKPQQK